MRRPMQYWRRPYFFLPDEWQELTETRKALNKPGLAELYDLRRPRAPTEPAEYCRDASQLFGAPSLIQSRIMSIVAWSRNGPPCGIWVPTVCVPSSLWIR